jgi:hypothetical protein
VRSKDAVGVSAAHWNDDGFWDDELVWSDDLVFIALPNSILLENGVSSGYTAIRIDVIVREVFRICASLASGQDHDLRDLSTLLRIGVFN